LTSNAADFVEFTAPGGTFTAAFGGDFPDIGAVNGSIGAEADLSDDAPPAGKAFHRLEDAP
jgi:hypothetical protein